MSTATTLTAKEQRLVDLAVWAAGEDAKRRLGLPNEWYQGSWFAKFGRERTGTPCGTACCIAGKVAFEDGGIPVVFDENDYPLDYERSKAIWLSPQPFPARHYTSDDDLFFPDRDEPVAVDAYGRQALGLDYDQAERLFAPDNDLDDIVRLVGEFLHA